MKMNLFYNLAVTIISMLTVSTVTHANPTDALTQLGKEAEGYELVYDLDLSKISKNIVYDQDRRTQITKPFTRIAYLLEVTTSDGKAQHAFVSMDAFTTDLSKIGIPVPSAGATFQQKINNMTVISNVAGVVNGVNLATGNIEFWPNNYGGQNAIDIPNADPKTNDFGDQITVEKPDGYGCLQIHNYEAKQTILAINNFAARNSCDVGIGNCTLVVAEDVKPKPCPDWTFSKSGASYSSKRLRVFVR